MQTKRKQGVCLATSPVAQDEDVSESSGANRGVLANANGRAKEFPIRSEEAFREADKEAKGVQRDFGGPIIRFPAPSSKAALPCNGITRNGKPTRPNVQNQVEEPVEPFPYAGYLGQILEAFMHALCLLFIKLLPVENSLQEKAKACMIRGLFMALCNGLQILYQGHSFKVAQGELLLNISRALLGGFNILLTFVVLSYISIGEASAILYSSCVWTCLLSQVILREAFQQCLIVALPLSLVGIILLAKPDLIVDASGEFSGLIISETTTTTNIISNITTNVVPLDHYKQNETIERVVTPTLNQIESDYFEQRWPGIALALLGSLVLSVVIIILKFRKKTPITTCSFYLGAAIFLAGFLVQLVVGFGAPPSTLLECFLHLCIGLLSFWAQHLFQWSLIYVKAGSFSVIQSLDIVLGFVLGALFLNELILWTSVLGSTLIIVVVVMLVFNDFLVARIKSLLCSN